MEEKKGEVRTRQEVANLLEALAGQLRQGYLEVKGRRIKVQEELNADWDLKEKKGRLGATLKLRWSVLETMEPSARQAAERQMADFKGVKKRLGTVLAELDRAVQQGTMPAVEKMAEFIRLNEEFNHYAEPDWAEQMQEYLDHVENLALAVKLRNLEMVKHELADLKNQMRACHAEAK